MKRSLLASLVALAATQAAGCIIYDDGYYDPPPPPNDAARITAQWSFRKQATQTTVGCPSGYDTVAVHSTPIDATGRPTGEAIVDLFDCADGAGTTAPLVPDVYETFISITDSSGSNVFAQSLAADVDVIDADKTFQSDILVDGGYFQLSWNLVGKVSNKPLECDQIAGLQGIQLVSTIAGAANATTDKFTCSDHSGVTGGLLNGTYSVSISAMNAGDGLGSAPMLANKVIKDRNQVTDLGTVSVPIDGR
jgi:hypothetical protein